MQVVVVAADHCQAMRPPVTFLMTRAGGPMLGVPVVIVVPAGVEEAMAGPAASLDVATSTQRSTQTRVVGQRTT